MFTRDFYSMIRENFSEGQHGFLAKSKHHSNFQNKNSAHAAPPIYNPFSLKGLRMAYQSDGLVAHGFISLKVLLFFAFQPWLLKKTNWVIWGGDIYRAGSTSRSIQGHFDFIVRRFVYRRVALATTVALEDYDYAVRTFGLKAPEVSATYPVPSSRPGAMESLLSPRRRREDQPLIIQVGNSATESNHHVEALDAISHLQHEDLRIFLPLNYGGAGYEEYRQQVIDHAKSLFGDKVDVLLERVNGDEYLDLLRTVDVGIFNNDRQQAMGNISQLALAGAKIYMRSDTSMSAHFTSLGINYFDITGLESISIEQLRSLPKNIEDSNRNILRERHSMKNKLNEWSTVFETMAAECVKPRAIDK